MKVSVRPLGSHEFTPAPTPGFSAPWSSTLKLIDREARPLGAREVIIEAAFTSRQIRKTDGWPKADARAAHAGVVVWLLDTKWGDAMYDSAAGHTWQDSVRAVALALESLRRIDRYGVGRQGQQYRGFRALPPGGYARGRELVERYGSKRKALSATHPDNGGDADDFEAVKTQPD